MQASSTSSFKNSKVGGQTSRGAFAALLFLIVLEIGFKLTVSIPEQALKADPILTNPSPDILVVGDSRANAIWPMAVSEAWKESGPRPSVVVLSLDGANVESLARFAMNRVAQPKVLVICQSYHGFYASPHGTNERLKALPSNSVLSEAKVLARERLRNSLMVWLNAPVLDNLSALKAAVSRQFNLRKTNLEPLVPAIEAPAPGEKPQVAFLELLAVENQFRRVARRVIPRHRVRAWESKLKAWQSDGVRVVFLRLPVAGTLIDIEGESGFPSQIREFCSRNGFDFFDINDYEWVESLRLYMPDYSHIRGDELRIEMSQKIGKLIFKLLESQES